MLWSNVAFAIASTRIDLYKMERPPVSFQVSCFIRKTPTNMTLRLIPFILLFGTVSTIFIESSVIEDIYAELLHLREEMVSKDNKDNNRGNM